MFDKQLWQRLVHVRQRIHGCYLWDAADRLQSEPLPERGRMFDKHRQRVVHVRQRVHGRDLWDAADRLQSEPLSERRHLCRVGYELRVYVHVGVDRHQLSDRGHGRLVYDLAVERRCVQRYGLLQVERCRSTPVLQPVRLVRYDQCVLRHWLHERTVYVIRTSFAPIVPIVSFSSYTVTARKLESTVHVHD